MAQSDAWEDARRWFLYGYGLALHTTILAVIGGTLTAEVMSAAGARVSLALPLAEH